jgi:hypothetical protein
VIHPTPRRTQRRLTAARRRRGAALAGARLFLFEKAVASSKAADVLLAEVPHPGWDLATRTFEQGAQSAIELVVSVDADLSATDLARVSAWAVVEAGATEGSKYLANLYGVPAHAGEPAWRLRSTGRAGTYTLPVEEEAFAIVTSGGDTWVTDSGEEIVYQ